MVDNEADDGVPPNTPPPSFTDAQYSTASLEPPPPPTPETSLQLAAFEESLNGTPNIGSLSADFKNDSFMSNPPSPPPTPITSPSSPIECRVSVTNLSSISTNKKLANRQWKVPSPPIDEEGELPPPPDHSPVERPAPEHPVPIGPPPPMEDRPIEDGSSEHPAPELPPPPDSDGDDDSDGADDSDDDAPPPPPDSEESDS